MIEWQLADPDVPVPPSLLDAVGGRRELARMLVLRGHTDPEGVQRFLNPDLYEPAPPSALPDLNRAADRIEQAIRGRERVLVWGDFDVDGQTSTALLVSALTELGLKPSYHIPIRETESHGIGADVLNEYLVDGIDLLLTCDTGIAAVDAVALAQQAGVDAVITDHHDLPSELPDAFALVNPKFLDERHPLATLPGVGVAFKLVEALYDRAGRSDETERFLDLVALGIVADLAHQVDDTRYLLQRGLHVLRKSERPGLQAICERANIDMAHLTEDDIGFGIGPRLNAVGRLGDANVAVPLLTTQDAVEAGAIADRLEQLNLERRFLTDQVYESALEQIRQRPSLLQYAVLVLGHEAWHQGVIGIVASRLVEMYGKPTILFSMAEGMVARGSARSIDGYNITRAIATQRQILHGFGGHPMAAGLSMPADRLESFRRGVSKGVIDQRDGSPPKQVLHVDSALDLDAVDLALADELEALAPFGLGNRPVNILCRSVKVSAIETLGQAQKHRKLSVQDRSGTQCEIMWWNSAKERLPAEQVDVVLRIRPSFFRGERGFTLTLQHVRATSGRRLRARATPEVHVTDYRRATDPHSLLAELLDTVPGLQVWCEALTDGAPARTREELEPGSDLAIWSAPPSQQLLDRTMTRINPTRVYLFALDPKLDTPSTFLKRLAGLARYTLERYDGESTLAALAAAMAHTEHTVRLGLASLRALGIGVEVQNHRVILERIEREPVDNRTLEEALAEASAFRQHVRSARQPVALFGTNHSVTPLEDVPEGP